MSALPDNDRESGFPKRLCPLPTPPSFAPTGRYWTTVQWREKSKKQQYVYKIELVMERDVLSRAEEYRKRARDCEQAAQETVDGGMKALFQELGNQWLHLANEAEFQKEKMQ
jgi:hypothetical protein